MQSWLLNPLACRRLWQTAMLVVVIGSLIPLNVPETAPMPNDKLQHFAAYALLAALALLAFVELRPALRAALAMVLLGAAIEVVQYFLPWRHFEWLDILANGVGVAAGIAVGLLARHRLPGWR